MAFNKFRMIRYFLTFLLIWNSLPAQKPTYSNERPKLPRDKPYQVALCNWMESLEMEDVTLAHSEVRWDGTIRDTEHASRLWGYFGYGGPKPGTVMQCKPFWFVLDDGNGHGIEGSGRVRQPRFANSSAVYRIMDLPMADQSQGNPYFGSDALANRALVATAVDLMMTDDSHTKISSIARSDFLGGSMNAWVETFGICRDVLGSKARQGFEQGFEEMVDKYLQWGPRDVNTNMDMRAVAAVARLYSLTESPRLKNKCLRVAKRFLFGFEDGSLDKLDSIKGTYFPAGYIGENNGPETTYNGVSYYHLLEARCEVPDEKEWAFLDPIIESMVRFKLYQYFPDEGRYDGPSGYACRTGNSYVYDQRRRAWRDVAAADMYPEVALPLIYSKQWRRPKLPPLEELVARTKSQVRRLAKYGAGKGTDEAPMVWEADHRQHWPPDGTYFSRPGWYDRLQSAYKKQPPHIHAPWDKAGHSFNQFFGEPGKEEFWAYRNAGEGQRDFGFFVEHVPRTWPYGSWAGGSLQTFWTRDAGILLLAAHDKTGDEFHKNENTRVYKVIDQWATDHVWGRNREEVFTTATAFNMNATQVNVSTGPAPYVETITKFRDSKGNLYGDVTLTSRFDPLPNGLQVTKSLSGQPECSELWLTIPVYLRDARAHKDLPDTQIKVTPSLAAVRNVQLTRRESSATIHFSEPQKIRFPEPWQAAYQSRARIQNIQVDMKGKEQLVWEITVG